MVNVAVRLVQQSDREFVHELALSEPAGFRALHRALLDTGQRSQRVADVVTKDFGQPLRSAVLKHIVLQKRPVGDYKHNPSYARFVFREAERLGVHPIIAAAHAEIAPPESRPAPVLKKKSDAPKRRFSLTDEKQRAFDYCLGQVSGISNPELARQRLYLRMRSAIWLLNDDQKRKVIERALKKRFGA
jgi:hypothetical protein